MNKIPITLSNLQHQPEESSGSLTLHSPRSNKAQADRLQDLYEYAHSSGFSNSLWTNLLRIWAPSPILADRRLLYLDLGMHLLQAL